MNRKILDVTMLCTLCICLMVAANIEEKNTIRESREEISSAYVISAADKAEVPVAGVCRVLSGYSFTTESDEAHRPRAGDLRPLSILRRAHHGSGQGNHR